jgi:hypothetical protein
VLSPFAPALFPRGNGANQAVSLTSSSHPHETELLSSNIHNTLAMITWRLSCYDLTVWQLYIWTCYATNLAGCDSHQLPHLDFISFTGLHSISNRHCPNAVLARSLYPPGRPRASRSAIVSRAVFAWFLYPPGTPRASRSAIAL